LSFSAFGCSHWEVRRCSRRATGLQYRAFCDLDCRLPGERAWSAGPPLLCIRTGIREQGGAHIRADSPLLQLAAAWNACRARILAPTVGHGRQLPTICRIFAAALHSLAARTNASTGEHDSPRRGGFNILISKYIFLIAPEGADRSLTARTYWNVTPTCRIIVATQSGAALEGRRESKGMRISCDR